MTLIEAVVALTVAAVMFAALAGSALIALKGSLIARQNQQSVDVLNKTMEQMRSYDFPALSMVTTDLTGDTSITTSGGSYFFDPGTGTAEPIVSGTVGSINPHTQTQVLNSTTYTIKRYVTAPTDATGAVYRRLTVVVSWNSARKAHVKKVNSLIVETRRGLPLPRFKFQPIGAQTKAQGPGTVLDYGFSLNNLGARDAWTITSTGSSTWTYYADDNGDGVHQAGETTVLTNAANGYPSTGSIEPNGIFKFVASRTLGLTEVSTQSVTFTVTSVAQPAVTSAQASLTDGLTITSGVATTTPPATTTAPATTTPPATTAPPVSGTGSPSPAPAVSCTTGCTVRQFYSIGTTASSTLTGSAPSAATPQTVAMTRGTTTYDTRYQLPAAHVYGPSATVTIYVRCVTANAAVTFNAVVGSGVNSSSFNSATTTAGVGSLSTCSTSTYTPLTIPVSGISGSNASIAKNKYLVVRVTLTSGSGSDVVLAQNSTAFPTDVKIQET